MTTVYFATNRKPDPNETGGFGAGIVAGDPAAITYATAEVTGINLADETSGKIIDISDRTQGNFADAAQAAIIGAGKNLLIFIHGFDNTFNDAMRRAAFNREWFAASGVAAADTTVVAFTWPSAGKLIAAPPHFPPEAYLADQAQAGRSGIHITYFLSVIDQLRVGYRAQNPNGRIFLLAHSMGNYALQAGVQAWFGGRGSQDLMFDEVFLPAADERYNSFLEPNGMRLSDLPELSGRISLYYSRRDVAMYLSQAINLTFRLGFNGPDEKTNTTDYPTRMFRILDSTHVADFDALNPPDATHQYYRRSKIVRADIASCMADDPNPAGGLITLSGG
jgi:esterase/lipase superfamily enzyme